MFPPATRSDPDIGELFNGGVTRMFEIGIGSAKTRLLSKIGHLAKSEVPIKLGQISAMYRAPLIGGPQVA